MPSTARQLALYSALVDAGVTTFVPRFAHMPLVLGEVGNKKLSKRDPKADLFLQREKGFVHEGLLNYLSLLGWAIGPDRDVFSLEELVQAFDIVDVNPNPARFDQKKAESINGDHIRMLEPADFAARIVHYLHAAGLVDETPTPDQQALIEASAPLVQERVQLLGDVPGLLGFLFRDHVDYDDDALATLPENTGEVLVASVAALGLIPDAEFTAAAVQEALASALIEGLELKPRVAYGPLRVALTGRRVSPPLFESMELLGKDESIRRLGALVEHRA
jgi:glutamyl-tRNA synthetase